MLNFLWNKDEKRIRAIWRLIIQIMLFFAFSGIIGASFGLVFGIIVAINQGFVKVISDPEGFSRLLVHLVNEPPALNLIIEIISLAAMLLSLWVASRWIDRRPIADYGFHFTRKWWRDVAFGLCLGLLMMTIIFLVEFLSGWIVITGIVQPKWPGMPFGLELLLDLVFFICAAVSEEVFSRGYQMRNIAEGLNLALIGKRRALIAGYLISSFIFGSLHLFNPHASLLSSFNIIVAGLLLGSGFLFSGELAIPIGLHFAWNFTQGNIFGFPVSGTDAGATVLAITQHGPTILTGGAFGPEGGLLGLMVLLMGGLMTGFWLQHTRGKLALAEKLAEYS